MIGTPVTIAASGLVGSGPIKASNFLLNAGSGADATATVFDAADGTGTALFTMSVSSKNCVPMFVEMNFRTSCYVTLVGAGATFSVWT